MQVQLVVMRGNPRGRTLTFNRGEYLFGRGPECHVRPDSEWISRQHCLLIVDENGVRLRDLGSTNGTLINGQRLRGECVLRSQDTLQLGPLELRLDMPVALIETIPPANNQTSISLPAERVTAE